MEQKQLDEVDDSFFTEEFIDEDDLAKYNKYDFPDEKIDPFAEDKRDRGSYKREEKKVLEKFPRKKPVEEQKSTPKSISSKPIIAKEIKPLEKKDLKDTERKEKKKEEPKQNSEDKKVKADNISSSKPELFDPWKEEKDSGEGLFKEASTWKAITGIMIILLIFSVFTDGFKFSQPTGAAVSIKDAEKTVLDYVNNNLLQVPFVAELQGSEDTGDLYKIQLLVAGQEIDSYVTKDGKLFFPQGFDITKPLAEEVLDSVEVESSNQPNVDVPIVSEEVIVPEETDVVSSTEEVSLVLLNAKRWVFTPNRVEVRKGNIVQLNIVPEDLDFTFSIPGLNIETEVKGKTVIEFKADEEGEFPFTCQSCEEWRGMNGKLVVK